MILLIQSYYLLYIYSTSKTRVNEKLWRVVSLKNENSLAKDSSLPVLLILFNRPQYLKESILSINDIKPKKLYIHIDGPRNKDDSEKIEEIRTPNHEPKLPTLDP